MWDSDSESDSESVSPSHDHLLPEPEPASPADLPGPVSPEVIRFQLPDFEEATPDHPPSSDIDESDAFDHLPDPGSLDDTVNSESNADWGGGGLSGSTPLAAPEIPIPKIWELKVAQDFVDGLQNASLANSGLPPKQLERLQNPPSKPLDDELDRCLRYVSHGL